ncbi:hypothetical protein HanIR_Chr05g0247961 [Helianthus annuus]|nr:hypothetical protein HanIR_Chr05g0247961 [Helianthus annuus]
MNYCLCYCFNALNLILLTAKVFVGPYFSYDSGFEGFIHAYACGTSIPTKQRQIIPTKHGCRFYILGTGSSHVFFEMGNY